MPSDTDRLSRTPHHTELSEPAEVRLSTWLLIASAVFVGALAARLVGDYLQVYLAVRSFSASFGA